MTRSGDILGPEEKINRPTSPEKQQELNRKLLKAVRSGDYEKVSDLLRNEADPNTMLESNGVTVFMMAFLAYDIEVALELLKYGAKIDARTKGGQTALQIAANSASGAKINAMTNAGQTALQIAANSASEKDYKKLINQIINFALQNPLVFAALLRSGNLNDYQVLKYINKETLALIEQAVVDDQDQKGPTSLRIALDNNDKELVNQIVKFALQSQLALAALLRSCDLNDPKVLKYIDNQTLGLIANKLNDFLLQEVINNNHQKVSDLLELGANPNTTENKSSMVTVLMIAVVNCDLETATTLIAHGAEIGDKNKRGETALKIAADLGKLGDYYHNNCKELINKIIKCILSDKEQNPGAFTGLLKSGDLKDPEVLKYIDEETLALIKQEEANITKEEKKSRLNQELLRAVRSGDDEKKILDLLKPEADANALKADANTRFESNGVTVLTMALYNLKLETAKILITFKAKIDARDNKDRTALRTAADFADIVPGGDEDYKKLINDIIEFILSGKEQNPGAFTGLLKSGDLKDPEVLKYIDEETLALIKQEEAKEEPKIPAEEQISALTKKLEEAVKKGRLEDVKSFLKELADFDAKNKSDNTAFSEDDNRQYITQALTQALALAAMNGHLEIVLYLLKCGASIDGEYAECSPLCWAVFYDHFEVVEALLQKGANPDYNNSQALRYAASKLNEKIVKILLKQGANIVDLPKIIDNLLIDCFAHKSDDDQIKFKIINWMIFSTLQNPAAFTALLESGNLSGANPDYNNSQALRYAASKPNEKIVKILLKQGANIVDLPKIIDNLLIDCFAHKSDDDQIKFKIINWMIFSTLQNPAAFTALLESGNLSNDFFVTNVITPQIATLITAMGVKPNHPLVKVPEMLAITDFINRYNKHCKDQKKPNNCIDKNTVNDLRALRIEFLKYKRAASGSDSGQGQETRISLADILEANAAIANPAFLGAALRPDHPLTELAAEIVSESKIKHLRTIIHREIPKENQEEDYSFPSTNFTIPATKFTIAHLLSPQKLMADYEVLEEQTKARAERAEAQAERAEAQAEETKTQAESGAVTLSPAQKLMADYEVLEKRAKAKAELSGALAKALEERAKARAEQAEAQAERAKQAEEAEAQAKHAKAKAEEAKAQAEEAKAKAESGAVTLPPAQAERAKAQAEMLEERAKALAERAKAHAELAEAQAERAKAQAELAEAQAERAKAQAERAKARAEMLEERAKAQAEETKTQAESGAVTLSPAQAERAKAQAERAKARAEMLEERAKALAERAERSGALAKVLEKRAKAQTTALSDQASDQIAAENTHADMTIMSFLKGYTPNNTQTGEILSEVSHTDPVPANNEKKETPTTSLGSPRSEKLTKEKLDREPMTTI
jgi:ankyrin repeat protein